MLFILTAMIYLLAKESDILNFTALKLSTAEQKLAIFDNIYMFIAHHISFVKA